MGEAIVGNGRRRDRGVVIGLSHLPEQLSPAPLSEMVCVRFPGHANKEQMGSEIVTCYAFYYSGF